MRPRPEAVRSAFYSDLLERIRRYPEVESASIASRAPLIGGFLRPPFRIEGRAASNQESAAITAVGSSYFSTLNIGFVAGQPFKDNEQAAVINETMARKFWPNADPVGSRIKSGPSSGPWLTIVGVVRDEKLHPGVKGMPQVYEPCRLCTALLIKTRDAATDIPGVIRREIAALDATTLVTSIQTVDEQISRLDTVVGYRFRMALFLAFAGAGLLLAFAGVYGVTSYSAAQRTHEVGIRMALGATRRNVLGMIIRQSMVPALTGITAGVAGAAGLSRLLESYLFEIAPTDTTVFIAAVIFIAFVAMAANFIPARRSTHVDPLVALKYE
jgi:putative ABC transport system permease protein